MINKILWDLINTEEVVSFINNIIIGMEKEKGHNKVVKDVMERLVENYLYIKPEKCKWKVREVEFLGVVIGLEEIKIEKEKVKTVLDWLTLKEVKDIQKFLGLANYYQQFIKDSAVIARPLYNLVNKNLKQDWIKKQEKTFKELKEIFTKELVLPVLNLDKSEDGS